ncbi:MAG TPA: YiiX/YebB-like N1pC/P60 family cysteine hydrolase [Cerasibacillus sp.]
MKRIGLLLIVIFTCLSGTMTVSASAAFSENDVFSKIAHLQQGVSIEEVKESVTIFAKEEGLTITEAADMILKELEDQIAQDEKERNQLAGGSSGNYKLKPSERNGDIYYTPSTTLGVPHGHNGIYYNRYYVVESLPSTGVRMIRYNDRNVEKNAVMQKVKTTQTNRDAAANWAKSRVGDPYSYNFATNRHTGHYGAKNCSKLLWSAYLLNAGIDIDYNKGAGVYPKDIRDSSYVETYLVIQ